MGPEDTSHLLSRLSVSISKGDKSPLLICTISLLESVPTDGRASADTLSSLLTDVLKPLFASTSNPSLTPAGRRNLVPAPPAAGRFDAPLLETERKPWKQASWSIDVLGYIVAQYDSQPAASRKDIVERQFYLLVPPILTLIDDGDVSIKTSGCEILGALCNTISASKSAILARSGLSDVFAGSLKANFMLLPTLTPESESLALLRQLYPAFRTLTSATHPIGSLSISTQKGQPGEILFKSSAAEDKKSHPYRAPRQQMLDTILRHGVLASYNHASDHVAIAAFLIQEAAFVVEDMRINAVKYLSQLLPLLRSILTNPLGAAYPPLLEAACELLSSLITNCQPRIASTWWVECLRMCVGCWVIIRIDLPGSTPVQMKLVTVVQSLRDIVGYERFDETADTLIAEDDELKDLFNPA